MKSGIQLKNGREVYHITNVTISFQLTEEIFKNKGHYPLKGEVCSL